jgi:hypothetical protein
MRPDQHGTDGFFAAVLERAKPSAPVKSAQKPEEGSDGSND